MPPKKPAAKKGAASSASAEDALESVSAGASAGAGSSSSASSAQIDVPMLDASKAVTAANVNAVLEQLQGKLSALTSLRQTVPEAQLAKLTAAYKTKFDAQEALIASLRAEVARLSAKWEEDGPAPPKAVAASKPFKDAVVKADAAALELTAAKGNVAVLNAQVASLTAELHGLKAAVASASGGGVTAPFMRLLSGVTVTSVALPPPPQLDMGNSSSSSSSSSSASASATSVSAAIADGEGTFECSVTDPPSGAVLAFSLDVFRDPDYVSESSSDVSADGGGPRSSAPLLVEYCPHLDDGQPGCSTGAATAASSSSSSSSGSAFWSARLPPFLRDTITFESSQAPMFLAKLTHAVRGEGPAEEEEQQQEEGVGVASSSASAQVHSPLAATPSHASGGSGVAASASAGAGAGGSNAPKIALLGSPSSSSAGQQLDVTGALGDEGDEKGQTEASGGGTSIMQVEEEASSSSSPSGAGAGAGAVAADDGTASAMRTAVRKARRGGGAAAGAGFSTARRSSVKGFTFVRSPPR